MFDCVLSFHTSQKRSNQSRQFRTIPNQILIDAFFSSQFTAHATSAFHFSVVTVCLVNNSTCPPDDFDHFLFRSAQNTSCSALFINFSQKLQNKLLTIGQFLACFQHIHCLIVFLVNQGKESLSGLPWQKLTCFLNTPRILYTSLKYILLPCKLLFWILTFIPSNQFCTVACLILLSDIFFQSLMWFRVFSKYHYQNMWRTNFIGSFSHFISEHYTHH